MEEEKKENFDEESIDHKVYPEDVEKSDLSFIDIMEETSLDVGSVNDYSDIDLDSDELEEKADKELGVAESLNDIVKQYSNDPVPDSSNSEFNSEETEDGQLNPSILDLINVEASKPKDSGIDNRSATEMVDFTSTESMELDEGSVEAKKEERRRAKQKQYTHIVCFIVALIVLVATAALSLYIALPAFGPLPEVEGFKFHKRKKTLSATKLKIDPSLKDEKKLNKYLDFGESLYKKKKYKKAKIVFEKILPTGWESSKILANIGKCCNKLEDKEGEIEYYKKALLSKDFNGNADLALSFVALLEPENRYKEIVEVLEPIQEKLSNPIKIQMILAKSYWILKMPDETLRTYRKINKQYLEKDQLMVYVDLLMKDNDQKEAFNVYLYLAQNFNYLEGFYQASKIAPTLDLKVAVLSELSGKTIGGPKWNYYNMLLGKALYLQGSKREALKVLQRVKPERLSSKDMLYYLELISSFSENPKMQRACGNILSKEYLDDMNIQIKIRDILLKNNKKALASYIFKKQVKQFPQSDIANYMYATVAPSAKLKQEYCFRAIKINTSFYDANLALGESYCLENRWEEGIKMFQKASLLRPKDNRPQHRMAIAKIRSTKSDLGLIEYSKFLDAMNFSEEFKLRELLLVSQYLLTDAMALKYLNLMTKIPSMKKFMDREFIKTKLLYGTLKESDFTGKSGREIKQYYIIFLLGKGEVNKVMMLPILKSEFPDFWKVFICWRKKIISWRKNSKLLILKNPDNKIYKLASLLWQNEISINDVEKQIQNIEYGKRPLIYFMIAERYRKNRNKIKASIFYHTAMGFEPLNIYKGVIKFFKNN